MQKVYRPTYKGPMILLTLLGILITQNCPSISHLFFADDSLIFCKAKIEELYTVKMLFGDYERAFDQKVNFDKSALWVSPDLHDDFWEYLKTRVGMRLVPCLVDYLCLPSVLSRSK